MNNQIKSEQLAADIAEFLANGGQIKAAVNTNISPGFQVTNPELIEKKRQEEQVKPKVQKPKAPRKMTYYALARLEAEKEGLKRYRGKPCKICQKFVRFVSNNTCVECSNHYSKMHHKKKKGGAA